MQVSSKAEFELIPRSEAFSFAVREFKLPAFSSPWHFHPECELTYIVQSRGGRFVGDSIEPFVPGEVVLLGSNLPHYWRNDEPAAGKKDAAHSIVIQFREECLGTDFLSRPELTDVRRLLMQARRGCKFTPATSAAVAEIMGQMSSRKGLQRVIDLLEIFRRLLEDKDAVFLSSAGFSPYLDQFAGERINRAYQHIFAHFTGALDHHEIARGAGMSHSAFCHYFKRVTGRTLTEFINEVRIGHARKLLLESERTIAEVAYASGYETLSNFNRRFRDITGVSPKEYRQRSKAA
jgi:AraC-like DNA-binding protein